MWQWLDMDGDLKVNNDLKICVGKSNLHNQINIMMMRLNSLLNSENRLIEKEELYWTST